MSEQPQLITLPPFANPCSHVADLGPVTASGSGCQECLANGDQWVHLRVCMICGHVGCCDSSPGKHATAHYHETGHPVIRSLERGEYWVWCYEDQQLIG